MNVKNKLKDKAQTTKGHLKEDAGKVTNNHRRQADGLTERTGGELKQAGEKIKDTVRAITH